MKRRGLILASLAIISLAFVVILGFLFVFRNAGPVGQPANTEASGSGDGENVVVSASRVPYDEREYVAMATRVVLGKVERLLPSEWDDDHRFIVTPTVISVSRHIKGSGQPKELTVYQRGGRVGNITMSVADGPSLGVGEAALFFLYSSPDRSTEKFTGVAAFKIERGLVQIETPRRQPETVEQVTAKLESALRGEFRPTPTPVVTPGPRPTEFPSGGLYPPKPPQPVKPGE